MNSMDREAYSKLKTCVTSRVDAWMKDHDSLRFYWEPTTFRRSVEVTDAVTLAIPEALPAVSVQTVDGFWIGPLYKPCSIHPDIVGYEAALKLQLVVQSSYESLRRHRWLRLILPSGEFVNIDPTYMQFTNSSTFDFEEAVYHGSWHCHADPPQ